jgi:hypothetical protein
MRLQILLRLPNFHALAHTCVLAATTLCYMPAVLPAAVINTSGSSFNMTFGLTWAGGAVPWVTDTANFVHAGQYTMPEGAVWEVGGITINADGIDLVQVPPAIITINLGSGGISGNNALGRIGAMGSVANLPRIVVGENDQTWSIPITNGVLADISGTATITHTSSARLWLRGANWGFTGIWRSDGGFIHPDGNPQWSGPNGALGQVLNNGIIRLSNSLYDRVSIEAVGNGILRVSGAATNTGAFGTMTRGSGEGTGRIFGGGNLTVDAMLAYGKLLLNGDITLEGDLIVADKAEGMFVELATSSHYTAFIGRNGQANAVRGVAAATSHLRANGTLAFNFVAPDYSAGSWIIFDRGNLNLTYGPDFRVEGFVAAGDGSWTLADNGATWTFSQATGVLSRDGEGGGGDPGPTTIFADDPLDASGWRITPLGWLDDAGYPYVYLLATGGWVYVDPDADRSSIYGYDYNAGVWFWTAVDIAGWNYDITAGSWRVSEF